MFACLVCLGGCVSDEPEIDTRYGLSSRAAHSLNSTSILLNKIRERGHNVQVKRRITPGIENFDAVIWAPDSTDAPSEKAIQALETWVNGYSDRTLIYVGRHYDAQSDYLSAIVQQAKGREKEEMLRRIAEKKVRDADLEYQWWNSPREDCTWFSLDQSTSTRTSKLSGPLVASIPNSELPELTYSVLLDVVDDYAPSGDYFYLEFEKEVLLEVDQKPFVSKLVADQDYAKSTIILVSNGCFLLNYGLVDPKKEILADRLLGELPVNANVLILESGPGSIPVSDSDYENHNSWAWVSEAPLRYIVPHFLVWGVVFCFVFFPIFGRPRRTEAKNITSFRNHIDAIARQFARSGGIKRARQIIQNYLKLADNRGK